MIDPMTDKYVFYKGYCPRLQTGTILIDFQNQETIIVEDKGHGI
jgi:hypothetical protein